MKTLALVNGDLVPGPSGHATISGGRKVRQDLSLMLGEEIGTDRFHPTEWGSTLPSYVGDPIRPDTESRVRSEVSRALSQYAAIQDQEVYQDTLTGSRSRFATADVVRQVNSISTRVTLDTIFISISLTTQAGEEVVLNRTVSL